MQSAASEVQAESEELERVMENLKQLAGEQQLDLRPAFHTFSKSLDRLKTAARPTETTGKRMAQKGDKSARELQYRVYVLCRTRPGKKTKALIRAQ